MLALAFQASTEHLEPGNRGSLNILEGIFILRTFTFYKATAQARR